MLGRCGNAFLESPGLQARHKSATHGGGQVGVFPAGFLDPGPVCGADEVQHGRERVLLPHGAHVLCRPFRLGADQVGIPGTGGADGLGIGGRTLGSQAREGFLLADGRKPGVRFVHQIILDVPDHFPDLVRVLILRAGRLADMAETVGNDFPAFFQGDFPVHQQFAGIDSVKLGGFFLERQPVIHGIHQFFQGTVLLVTAADQGHGKKD